MGAGAEAPAPAQARRRPGAAASRHGRAATWSIKVYGGTVGPGLAPARRGGFDPDLRSASAHGRLRRDEKQVRQRPGHGQAVRGGGAAQRRGQHRGQTGPSAWARARGADSSPPPEPPARAPLLVLPHALELLCTLQAVAAIGCRLSQQGAGSRGAQAARAAREQERAGDAHQAQRQHSAACRAARSTSPSPANRDCSLS